MLEATIYLPKVVAFSLSSKFPKVVDFLKATGYPKSLYFPW